MRYLNQRARWSKARASSSTLQCIWDSLRWPDGKYQSCSARNWQYAYLLLVFVPPFRIGIMRNPCKCVLHPISNSLLDLSFSLLYGPPFHYSSISLCEQGRFFKKRISAAVQPASRQPLSELSTHPCLEDSSTNGTLSSSDMYGNTRETLTTIVHHQIPNWLREGIVGISDIKAAPPRIIAPDSSLIRSITRQYNLSYKVTCGSPPALTISM